MHRSSGMGPLGRLAYWSVDHARLVAMVWIGSLLVVGVVFLPKIEHALAGSGMEHTGSDSIRARAIIQKENPLLASSAVNVVMHGRQPLTLSPGFQQAIGRVSRTLEHDPAIAGVAGPNATGLISRNGRTVVVSGGAGGNPREMVEAADRLRDKVRTASGPRYSADMGGLSATWADFNKQHKEAALRSEAYAFPLTLIVLVIAFGSILAAGLPLLIAATGLVLSAGVLYLGTRLMEISIWAETFVLIFSMALGVDYALFLVMRFREALTEHADPRDAAAVTMDTAGRAIGFSGLTVLVALMPCFLIPIPMPRSIALGTMLSVILILAAAFTVLPMLLARLGTRIDAGAMPWRRRTRNRPAGHVTIMQRWGQTIWNHPKRLIAGAVTLLVLLALPIGDLKIGVPGEKVQAADQPSRLAAERVRSAFGDPTLAPVTIVARPSQVRATRRAMRHDQDVLNIQPLPTRPGAEFALIQGSLTGGSDSTKAGEQIDRLRRALPDGTLLGGAPAELHDVSNAMADSAPRVIGMIVLLGFILLLIAVQAPVLALVGAVTSLLSTAASFGITVWIFQDGHLSGLLNFHSQGYLDFWAPVFFFAMIFAISMDYTVFYVSAARDEWDRTGNAERAIVHGMRRSGPVIVAAAAAMITVFTSFAFCTALAAKEMGAVLGLAVLFDAFAVRLLLLPALLRVAGSWTWWQPKLLGRLLPKFSLSHEQPKLEAPPAMPALSVFAQPHATSSSRAARQGTQRRRS